MNNKFNYLKILFMVFLLLIISFNNKSYNIYANNNFNINNVCDDHDEIGYCCGVQLLPIYFQTSDYVYCYQHSNCVLILVYDVYGYYCNRCGLRYESGKNLINTYHQPLVK